MSVTSCSNRNGTSYFIYNTTGPTKYIFCGTGEQTETKGQAETDRETKRRLKMWKTFITTVYIYDNINNYRPN